MSNMWKEVRSGVFTSLAVSLLMAAIATGWSYNGEQDKISRCPCPRGSMSQVTRAANDPSVLRIRGRPLLG